MPSTTLRRLTCIPLVKAPLACIPVPIVANSTVIEFTPDQHIADIAIVLGIHFDKVMLPFSITRLSLCKTIATNVVVAIVTLLTVRVGAANALVAYVTIETNVPGRILNKVSKVFRRPAMALLRFAFICTL